MPTSSSPVSAKIHSFTDLLAWREAHTLVIAIYRATQSFPKEEQFGLINQIRRAVISITSNIAEGFSRQHYKEKIQFYSTALSSLSEVQSQLLAARDLEFLDKKEFQTLADQTIFVSKLMNGLIKKSKTFLNS